MQSAIRKYNLPHVGVLFVFMAEALFFLLLLKQERIAMVYLTVLCTLIFLYFFPELSISILFTGSILLHILYDYAGLSFPYFALTMGFLLQVLGALIYLEKRCYQKEVYFGPLLKISAFIAILLIVGVLYSSNRFYGLTKTVLFILLNIPLIVIVSLYRNDVQTIQRILFLNVVIGLIVYILSLEAARNSLFFGHVRFRLSDNVGPLGIARPLCISFISAWFFILGKKNAFVKLLFGSVLPFLLMPIIWSGSRGPFLAVVASVITLFILQPRVRNWYKVFIVLIVLGTGAVYFVHSSNQVAERLATPLAEEASAAYRVLAWIQAVQDFAAHPITGIGTGSFYLETNWIPLVYPHNLFLELAGENGFIGLVLILLFLFFTIKYGLSAIRRFNRQNNWEAMQLTITISALFVNSLVNAMVSGNIAANYYVWITAGLIWTLYLTDRSWLPKVK